MNIHHTVRLSSRKLNIIRNIMHDYKDFHRGEPLVRLAMEVEAELQSQTGGDYQPDTTYDLK